MIVWERPEGYPAAAGWRALKIIRLHGAAINHLSTCGTFVVTGGADGLVRMFDAGMRLCAWFEDLAAGPIVCVSFATRTKGGQGMQEPHKACMQMSR